jgi:hypothetical protein
VERKLTSTSPPSVDAVGARLASPIPVPAEAFPLAAFVRATRADPAPAVASAPEPSRLARWTLSRGTSTSLP